MLISFIFFLLSTDSLPPLPDLAGIKFPEPDFWIEPRDNSFNIVGYAGDFYGGEFELDYQRLNVSVNYEKIHDWDSTRLGYIATSYSIPLSHLWLKPGVNGLLVQRDNRYRLITPFLNFSSTIPWAIIFGEVNYDLWQIDEKNYREEAAKLTLTFDQTPCLPQFEISEIYTNQRVKTQITGKLHIRNFHAAIGSPVSYGFPSPYLEIQYLQPKIKIETKIKSGILYNTMSQFFDAESPITYKIPVPDESLKLGIDFGLKFDLYNHFFGFSSSYKNWNARLIAGNDFELIKAYAIQEADLSIVIKNKYVYKALNLHNALQVQYNWSNKTIPFLAQYSLCDTISANLGFLEIASIAKYFSKRDGIDRELPAIFLLSPVFGLKFKLLKIFLMIDNITNEHKEFFDNHFINKRQYAGGLEIDYKF